MSAIILRGDARALPLPDESVDLIVTSPPYFGLRSYTDGGQHYSGQIGSEQTPAEFIAELVECTREWMRVLKPSGSIFVNLGDSYYSAKGAPTQPDVKSGARRTDMVRPLDRSGLGYPRKSLLLIPERYRIACLDQLGLTVRAVVVWNKPNGLPEAVTDRVRRSHEDWVHLTKGPIYFAAIDEIREPSSDYSRRPGVARAAAPGVRPRSMSDSCNPLGRLPGSVWEIASQPLTVPADLGVEHFAAFPTEWPRRIISAWSPAGYCTGCGEPRRTTVERTFEVQDDCSVDTAWKRDKHYAGNNWHDKPRGTTRVTAGDQTCGCAVASAPTQPAVVLDPFGGTGTVALVASALGRIGISNDMSADYCRIATWRTNDPAQRAKVLRLPKPPVERAGQMAFEFDGAA